MTKIMTAPSLTLLLFLIHFSSLYFLFFAYGFGFSFTALIYFYLFSLFLFMVLVFSFIFFFLSDFYFRLPYHGESRNHHGDLHQQSE